jgi:hypothetical protein
MALVGTEQNVTITDVVGEERRIIIESVSCEYP